MSHYDAVAIVPGHGPVQRDMSYIVQVRALLLDAVRQVRALGTATYSVDEVRARVDLQQWRRTFAGDDPGLQDLFDESIAQGLVRAAYAEQGAEESVVRRVVDGYLLGLKFNDVARLRAAFWPDARLYFTKKDGSLGQLTQAEWYKGFEASAGKEEAGTLDIVSVDVTGDAASVKVVETYPKSVYTDYLNLLRFAGEWRIVNKIYTSRPR